MPFYIVKYKNDIDSKQVYLIFLNDSVTLAWTDKPIDISEDQTCKRPRANRMAKVLFPLLTVPFNIIYLIISLFWNVSLCVFEIYVELI